MGLSHAQAVEVGRRLNPPPGRLLWFAENGTVVNEAEAQRILAVTAHEVYQCRRSESGGAVEVARVTSTDIEPGGAPAFDAW